MLTLTIFAKKEKKIPPAITASLAEHLTESVPEYISLTPPAFRLFAEGSEIIHHHRKFETVHSVGREKNFCQLA